LRSSTIRSTVPAGIAVGEAFGRGLVATQHPQHVDARPDGTARTPGRRGFESGDGQGLPAGGRPCRRPCPGYRRWRLSAAGWGTGSAGSDQNLHDPAEHDGEQQRPEQPAMPRCPTAGRRRRARRSDAKPASVGRDPPAGTADRPVGQPGPGGLQAAGDGGAHGGAGGVGPGVPAGHHQDHPEPEEHLPAAFEVGQQRSGHV
jgi:hypothetical protein